MSRPRSSPLLYLTMNEWCLSNAEPCFGKSSFVSGSKHFLWRSSMSGRIPIWLTMTP